MPDLRDVTAALWGQEDTWARSEQRSSADATGWLAGQSPAWSCLPACRPALGSEHRVFCKLSEAVTAAVLRICTLSTQTGRGTRRKRPLSGRRFGLRRPPCPGCVAAGRHGPSWRGKRDRDSPGARPGWGRGAREDHRRNAPKGLEGRPGLQSAQKCRLILANTASRAGGEGPPCSSAC